MRPNGVHDAPGQQGLLHFGEGLVEALVGADERAPVAVAGVMVCAAAAAAENVAGEWGGCGLFWRAVCWKRCHGQCLQLYSGLFFWAYE